MPGSSAEMAPRAGEVALPFDPGTRIDAGLSFIGTVRSPWARGTAPRNLRLARESGEGARIELAEGYAPGLAGLSVGQAIQMLYWVDRGERDLIVQSPAHADGPRGVFALRSPVRPNPIALGCVVITALDPAAGIIGIDATDAYDVTPVLDIKPWRPSIDTPPGWRPAG